MTGWRPNAGKSSLLTLAGYSINDTIVVFDRIRENLRKFKKMPLIDLMNLAINETLSRTVLTSVVTGLAVLALYVFGTEAIHGFSFAMLFGIMGVCQMFFWMFTMENAVWSASRDLRTGLYQTTAANSRYAGLTGDTLKTEFKIDDAGYAYLINVFQGCYAFMYPVAGWIVDRFGARRIMLVGRRPGARIAITAA